MLISPEWREKVGCSSVFLEKMCQLKTRRLFLSCRVGTRVTVLGCFITSLKSKHVSSWMNPSAGIQTFWWWWGRGGSNKEKRSTPPPSYPISFQPPTSEVGGSVITICDRDSDPQRSWASHPIPDTELRRWASKEGALWIPDERINRAWETRRGGRRCVWGVGGHRFLKGLLLHFYLSLYLK